MKFKILIVMVLFLSSINFINVDANETSDSAFIGTSEHREEVFPDTLGVDSRSVTDPALAYINVQNGNRTTDLVSDTEVDDKFFAEVIEITDDTAVVRYVDTVFEFSLEDVELIDRNDVVGYNHQYMDNEGNIYQVYSTNPMDRDAYTEPVLIDKYNSNIHEGIVPFEKYYTIDDMLIPDINAVGQNAKQFVEDNNYPELYNYPYFQFLPFRSKTGYSASDFNRFFKWDFPSSGQPLGYPSCAGGKFGQDCVGVENRGGIDYQEVIDRHNEHGNTMPLEESVMHNNAQPFLTLQNEQGVNAMHIYALAIHETGRGVSDLAYFNKNMFGKGADDLNEWNNANYYSNLVDGTRDEYKFINGQYANAYHATYDGAYFGRKGNGMNTYYATDPNWGNAITGHMVRIDNYLGGEDHNKYKILGFRNHDAGVTKVYENPNATNMVYSTDRCLNVNDPGREADDVRFMVVNPKFNNSVTHQVMHEPNLDTNYNINPSGPVCSWMNYSSTDPYSYMDTYSKKSDVTMTLSNGDGNSWPHNEGGEVETGLVTEMDHFRWTEDNELQIVATSYYNDSLLTWGDNKDRDVKLTFGGQDITDEVEIFLSTPGRWWAKIDLDDLTSPEDIYGLGFGFTKNNGTIVAPERLGTTYNSSDLEYLDPSSEKVGRFKQEHIIKPIYKDKKAQIDVDVRNKSGVNMTPTINLDNDGLNVVIDYSDSNNTGIVDDLISKVDVNGEDVSASVKDDDITFTIPLELLSDSNKVTICNGCGTITHNDSNIIDMPGSIYSNGITLQLVGTFDGFIIETIFAEDIVFETNLNGYELQGDHALINVNVIHDGFVMPEIPEIEINTNGKVFKLAELNGQYSDGNLSFELPIDEIGNNLFRIAVAHDGRQIHKNYISHANQEDIKYEFLNVDYDSSDGLIYADIEERGYFRLSKYDDLEPIYELDATNVEHINNQVIITLNVSAINRIIDNTLVPKIRTNREVHEPTSYEWNNDELKLVFDDYSMFKGSIIALELYKDTAKTFDEKINSDISGRITTENNVYETNSEFVYSFSDQGYLTVEEIVNELDFNPESTSANLTTEGIELVINTNDRNFEIDENANYKIRLSGKKYAHGEEDVEIVDSEGIIGVFIPIEFFLNDPGKYLVGFEIFNGSEHVTDEKLILENAENSILNNEVIYLDDVENNRRAVRLFEEDRGFFQIVSSMSSSPAQVDFVANNAVAFEDKIRVTIEVDGDLILPEDVDFGLRTGGKKYNVDHQVINNDLIIDIPSSIISENKHLFALEIKNTDGVKFDEKIKIGFDNKVLNVNGTSFDLYNDNGHLAINK